jgi:hypothetical protein
MPLVIQDTSHVPSNGWEYIVDQTNFTVVTRNYSILYGEIVKHCTSNNVPIPSQQSVIDRLCETLAIPCYDGMSPLVNKFTLNLPDAPRGGCCGGSR